MLSRRYIGALLALATFVLGPEEMAGAAEPTPAGVVVVAIGEASKPAAASLARDVYADSALLFPVTPLSDASARVLLGEAWPKDANPSVIELAKVRQELGSTDSDLTRRRLLSSIGVELGAELVVSVELFGDRAAAKILRSKSSAYEAVELSAAADKDANGTLSYRFTDAIPTLKGLLARRDPRPADTASSASPTSTSAPLQSAPAPQSKSPPPLVPTRTPAQKPSSGEPLKKTPEKPVPEPVPVWKSTWFWVALGGAAALGLTAFGIAKATENDGNIVHLGGRVSK